MSTVKLGEQPFLKTPWGRWQPLNGPLDVTAFGINAIVLDPGEEIDIEHDATYDPQEEIYVVVSGRAVFDVAGDEVTAAPGTIVSVPDPATVRTYRALDPGTRIVCIGAPVPENPRAFGTWLADVAAS